MIKRDYFIAGCVRGKDNKYFIPVYAHLTVRSWLPNTVGAIEAFKIKASVKADQGEVLEFYSVTQLRRYF